MPLACLLPGAAPAPGLPLRPAPERRARAEAEGRPAGSRRGFAINWCLAAALVHHLGSFPAAAWFCGFAQRPQLLSGMRLWPSPGAARGRGCCPCLPPWPLASPYPGSVTRQAEPRGAPFTFRGAPEGKRGASGLAVKGREQAALGRGPSCPGPSGGPFLPPLPPAPPRRALTWGKINEELCFLGLGAPCWAPAVTGRFV